MYWGHYWGMHMLWWIFWLLMIGTFVLWAWRSSETRRHDDAIDVLRRTYASGDISEEEYRRRLSVLNESFQPRPRPESVRREPDEQHAARTTV